MSRGFVCALVGIAMTLLAWFGPWMWPAWPAFTALHLAFRHIVFAALPYAVRSAAVVAAIAVNVAFWGVIAFAIIALKRP